MQLTLLVVILTYSAVSSASHAAVHKTKQSYKQSPPNILEILVDDLGYGDTGLEPFVGLGVSTPNLQRMAAKGTILTNYHTAAATCTPTRASILTGMYPWRIGIKAVFEYGKSNGLSNRNDWLPPLPTIPMVLREANYSVFHSGKWHLGGMRNDDWDLRMLPEASSDKKAGRRCPHPGPNQQGFKNYVSMLDGPGAPRQNRLQIPSKLYSQGCTALLHNDIDIGRGLYNITGYLSYCEAEHAIHAMNVSVAKNKPFFVQLWFHAPHAPLEAIPGYPEYMKKEVRIGPKQKNGLFKTRVEDVSLDHMGPVYQYRSMIADMDHQLGRILTQIEHLGIETNTLIVFTSDNGPEQSAGTTAGLRGQKRSLYEGGIRVPAIVQWVGTIPAGQISDAFAVSTDLFPTFLDAAGVRAPSHLRLDGLSLLPQLVPNYYTAVSTAPPALASHSVKKSSSTQKVDSKHPVDEIKDNPALYNAAMRDRVTLWHNDYEGPRRTAAWIYDYKVILNEFEQMSEMYDLQNDKYEKKNLINPHDKLWTTLNESFHQPGLTPAQRLTFVKKELKSKVTQKLLIEDRRNPVVHKHIASHLFKLLQDVALKGNYAHTLYMDANPGWRYPPTVLSDIRSDFIQGPGLLIMSTGPGAALQRQRLLNSTCGSSPCSCEVKLARNVPSLPFESSKEYAYFSPGKLLNSAELLAV